MNRKGISPVIATLLLVAIAVVLGLAVYAWAVGWVSSTTKGTEAAKGQLEVEAAEADDSADTITLWVRNVGGVNVKVTDAYVEYPDGTLKHGSSSAGITVNPQSVNKITIKKSGGDINISDLSIDSGKVYTVKLVASDGSATVANVRAHA